MKITARLPCAASVHSRCSSTRTSRQSALLGTMRRDMGEDVVGAVAEEVLGILQQQLAAGQLLLQGDRRGRHAVVDQVDRLCC